MLVDGVDVTGTGARAQCGHGVPAVHQLPSLKVFDNIASPLKLRREKTLMRVRQLAKNARHRAFWTATPRAVGGQQQRWRWPVRWPKTRR